MTDAKDEYYLDMLDGLALFLRAPLLADLSLTVSRLEPPGLGYALNVNQIRGKLWLLDELAAVAGRDLGEVLILGGWYAVLAAMLLNDPRFAPRRVTSLDRDASCRPVAESLNRQHLASGRFAAVTADMLKFDYRLPPTAGKERPSPDVIVNTSCEHLADPAAWLAGTPPDSLLVLQSNDYFACEEHLSCVADLDGFASQMALAEVLYRGQLRLKRYTRFMLIGRRGGAPCALPGRI